MNNLVTMSMTGHQNFVIFFKTFFKVDKISKKKKLILHALFSKGHLKTKRYENCRFLTCLNYFKKVKREHIRLTPHMHSDMVHAYARVTVHPRARGSQNTGK